MEGGDNDEVVKRNDLIFEWRGIPLNSNLPKQLKRLQDFFAYFESRPEDVFIVGYTKSGTHWMNEICHMLLTKQSEVRAPPKATHHVGRQEVDVFNEFPSPRIIHAHLNLPVLAKQLHPEAKIVLMVRNPKDVAVSLYHHWGFNKHFPIPESFEQFFEQFESGLVKWGSWFNFYRESLRFIDQKRHQNLLLVQYETLNRNTASEIQRIATFLHGEPISEKLLSSICEKVAFESMRKDRADEEAEYLRPNANFYRKGQVADWKNLMSRDISDRIEQMTGDALKGLEHLYQPVWD